MASGRVPKIDSILDGMVRVFQKYDFGGQREARINIANLPYTDIGRPSLSPRINPDIPAGL
jgi:hypothetical protein